MLNTFENLATYVSAWLWISVPNFKQPMFEHFGLNMYDIMGVRAGRHNKSWQVLEVCKIKIIDREII